MACFIVPTIIGIAVEKGKKKIPEHYHAGWLSAMIFGGAAALTVEHFAHGEIVPWFPFLTAMASPADTAAMLGEMAAVGVPMTIALFAAWAVLVLVYNRLEAERKAPSILAAR